VSYRSRDNQRTRLYRWERANLFPGAQKLTLSEAANLVRRICLDYGVPVAQVRYGGSGRKAYSIADRNLISLPDWGMTDVVVLHETAHHILAKNRDGHEPHGPEYVDLYSRLLERYTGRFVGMNVRRSAQVAGLHVCMCRIDPLEDASEPAPMAATMQPAPVPTAPTAPPVPAQPAPQAPAPAGTVYARVGMEVRIMAGHNSVKGRVAVIIGFDGDAIITKLPTGRVVRSRPSSLSPI
jgi:hypothetical protein